MRHTEIGFYFRLAGGVSGDDLLALIWDVIPTGGVRLAMLQLLAA
jgi:hypothetical protein